MKRRWLAVVAVVALIAALSSVSIASGRFEGSGGGGAQTQGLIRPTGIW